MSIVGSPVRVGVRARRRRDSAALGVRACRRRARDVGRRSIDELGVARAVMGIVACPVRVGIRARRRCINTAICICAATISTDNVGWYLNGSFEHVVWVRAFIYPLEMRGVCAIDVSARGARDCAALFICAATISTDNPPWKHIEAVGVSPRAVVSKGVIGGAAIRPAVVL